jgi:hypothetical protein
MKRLLALLGFIACSIPASSWADEVARVFSVPVSAAEIHWEPGRPAGDAVRHLKERVLKEALPRFVAANKLQATPQELAAYAKWEAEFRRLDRKRRAERLAELEAALKAPGLDESKRPSLAQERDTLQQLAKYDVEPRPASSAVHATWIEGYKVRKALYEKYGGRVGVTKWGPDPTGAVETLLREHQKRGDLQIVDPVLAREFWEALAREPRFLAKPDQIDFTYYWLKPVNEIHRAR